jgi:autotransporter translocation and assembly factor TamB
VAGTRRRLAIALGLVVALCALALVGSAWLAVRVWGPSLTSSRIAAAITEATGRPARVHDVILQPLRGRVRISGLAVDDAREPIRVEQIDVSIRIESLWRREIVVDIAGAGADVRLEAKPGPDEPIIFDVPERIRLGPITARLGSISLERSRLRFEDPPKGVAIALDGLAAHARPEAVGLELTARADVVQLRLADFQQHLERLLAEGRIDARRILVRRLDLNDPRHALRASGAIEAPWSREPTLAGEAKARLAAGPIAQGLGAAIAVDGALDVDVMLSGAFAAPVLAGRVRAQQLHAAGLPARDLTGALHVDEHAFTLSEVEGHLLGGRLHASLTIPSGRPQGALVRVRVEEVDAAALARLRGGTLDVRGRLALDGEVRGDFAQPMSLTGQVRVDGSDVSLPGALGGLGVGRIRAVARLGGGQVVADADGQWPSATVTAGARMDADRRLRGEARARADLAALPGWARGDQLDIAARADGRWPQTTFTAGVDLVRPAAGRHAGRIDVRVDPVPGTAPRWTGTVRSARFALPWVNVEDWHSALTLSTEALDVARPPARVAGVPVDGSGRWMWRGTGDARLMVGPAALARLPGISPDLAVEGTARAQIDAKLSTTGVHGAARIEAERVALAKVPIGRGTGEVTMQGRRLEAWLRFPERQLEVSARGDLMHGQVVSARAALRSFDLASLAAPPRVGQAPVLRGSISAAADLAIPVDAPGNLRGQLTLEPMTVVVAGASWSSAEPIVARIDGQRATLEPLRLTGSAGAITASGVVWDAGARPLVRARLDAGRLAALVPALGLDGRLQVEAELSGNAGTVAGGQARARAVSDGLVLPGMLSRLGKGASQVDIQRTDDVVSITRGDVAFPGLSGTVTGRIHLDGRLAVDARATAQAAPLGAAFGWSESSGMVTATAALGGRLTQPDGQARVSAERIEVAGVVVERIDGGARLQGETVRLDRLTARLLDAPVRIRGEWMLSGTGRAELEAGPLALARLPAPDRLALGGALSLRAEAAADRGALKARAQLQATDVHAAGLVLGAGRLTAQVDGRRLAANLDLNERRITGSASGTLEPGGAVEATLDVSTLELGPLLRQLSANPNVDVEGTATGRLTARAPWDRPAALTARARLDPIVLRSRQTGLEGRGRIEGNWQDRTLALERAELAGSAGTARASGTVDPAGRLDVKLEARMPLPALLAPVTDVSGSEGTVAVQAQVTGSLAEPSVRGEGSLIGGRIALRGFPAPLRDINARVVATPGGIRLIDATAALGGGSLRAAGEAALAGRALGLYRIRITARDVPLGPLEGLDMVWNADLELGGTEGRSLLSGEARLVRGHYGRDLVSLSALTAPQRADPGTSQVGLPLNIRALLDDNLVVRTAQARMRVGGTLAVRGTTAAPIVLGVIEARDGTLILRGQRYQLERAAVRFADPRRIEPTLDLTATTRIRDYDVTMRVTGRIRDLDMRLTSSPSLPREQLLSLVAFGTAGAETGQGAGGAFAGEAASLVVQELLDLSGTESAMPGPLRTFVERTRVNYTPSSEDVGRFGLRIEYEVAGPFLLAGERTSKGYYLIDGVVRLRFR